MKLYVWTDGTSRPKMISKKNKSKDGPSAIAIIIKNNETILYKKAHYIGIKDNNQAEYIAFIKAIEIAIELNASSVTFYTDSNLIEKQMNFKYNAYKQSIAPYYEQAKQLLNQLKDWEVIWISRKENKEADRLADKLIKNMLRNKDI